MGLSSMTADKRLFLPMGLLKFRQAHCQDHEQSFLICLMPVEHLMKIRKKYQVMLELAQPLIQISFRRHIPVLIGFRARAD